MEVKKNQISIDSIFYICFGSTLIGVAFGNFIDKSFLAVLAPVGVATVVTLYFYRFRTEESNQELLKDKYALAKDLNYEKEQANRYKHFAEAIIQGQEQEKKRLALELHDDTIQRLIIIGQRIQLISLDINKDAPNEDIKQVEDLINESIQSIRLFIKQLRPTYLDKLGLVPTLKELVTQVNENSDRSIHVAFDSIGNAIRLDTQVELALYRIAQSAVANAVRHSGGDRVKLKIDFLPESIDLSIEDNGKGFEIPDELSLLERANFGLMGMQERADFIGAEFSVHTGKTQGTRILIRVPAKQHVHNNNADENKMSVGHLI